MENFSHCFDLSENNKSKDHIKGEQNKSDYLDPKNWLEKIEKI